MLYTANYLHEYTFVSVLFIVVVCCLRGSRVTLWDEFLGKTCRPICRLSEHRRTIRSRQTLHPWVYQFHR
jgi:hypothetical protein